jgi:hypothetical protein
VTAPLNHCAPDADLLVPPQRPIPDDAADFVWPTPSPLIGCNHLVCTRCGAKVRNVAGWRLRGDVGAADCARLLALDDWNSTELPDMNALAERDSGERSYVCRCNGLAVANPRALHRGGIADDHPAPVGWGCGGHPPRSLPQVIATLATPLTAESARDTTTVGAWLSAEHPATSPASSWPGRSPALHLARQWYTLADRNTADALVAATMAHLDIDAPALAGGLAFIALLPAAIAATCAPALATLDANLPADFSDRRAPWPPHERMSLLYRRAATRAGPSA